MCQISHDSKVDSCYIAAQYTIISSTTLQLQSKFSITQTIPRITPPWQSPWATCDVFCAQSMTVLFILCRDSATWAVIVLYSRTPWWVSFSGHCWSGHWECGERVCGVCEHNDDGAFSYFRNRRQGTTLAESGLQLYTRCLHSWY